MKKLTITLMLTGLCFLCQAQEIKVEVKYVHFDASDTTLEFQISTTVDTLGIRFEDHRVSRKFLLKQSDERDSLRNNELVNAVLIRMGQFLSNQFPPE